MSLRAVLIEAVNLARTDSFPVFLDGKAIGRVYIVTSDDIDWLSQGKIDDADDYSVFVNGIEPDKLTEKNLKYYSFDGDADEADEKKKLASKFGRAFGYFDNVSHSRFK